MQMVPTCHPRRFGYIVLQLLHVNAFGNCIQREEQTLFQQSVSRYQNNDGNHKADSRIDPDPIGETDDDARNNHPYRHQRIHKHVQESAVDIEVGLAVLHQQPGGQSVDDDTCTGCPSDGFARHVCRIAQAIDAFNHNSPYSHQQDDGIQQRNQDSGFLVTIGEVQTGRMSGQTKCNEGQHQAEHVAQIVSGIGKQTQRIINKADNSLDKNEQQIQRYTDNEYLVKRIGHCM